MGNKQNALQASPPGRKYGSIHLPNLVIRLNPFPRFKFRIQKRHHLAYHPADGIHTFRTEYPLGRRVCIHNKLLPCQHNQSIRHRLNHPVPAGRDKVKQSVTNHCYKKEGR